MLGRTAFFIGCYYVEVSSNHVCGTVDLGTKLNILFIKSVLSTNVSFWGDKMNIRYYECASDASHVNMQKVPVALLDLHIALDAGYFFRTNA